MDPNDTVAEIRARFDHEVARRNLREKYQARLTFAHSGGLWRAGPELLNLLALYPDQHIVLEDLYHNPVRVNATELLLVAQGRWQEQMTAWLVEHHAVSQQR